MKHEKYLLGGYDEFRFIDLGIFGDIGISFVSDDSPWTSQKKREEVVQIFNLVNLFRGAHFLLRD